jgi:hypothetical protein
LNPGDVFVFFVASHGTVDEGEYFLITSNVGSTRTEKLKTDAIAGLADYVDNEVPVLAEKVFKKAQYPTISISGQAFPIGKTVK